MAKTPQKQLDYIAQYNRDHKERAKYIRYKSNAKKFTSLATDADLDNLVNIIAREREVRKEKANG